MPKKSKRKPGGQPGNQNARKHGFYSAKFNRSQQFEFKLAAGIEGIAEEIALLRCEIRKAVSGGDIANLVPLVKATSALEKLVRTHHKVFVGEANLHIYRLSLATQSIHQQALHFDPFSLTQPRHLRLLCAHPRHSK